jgi:uncharacterized protein YpmS
MYESWTVNWFIISNILTVVLVVVTVLVYSAREKKDQSNTEQG